ncbi:MAG: histidine kinase [Deltaproteobacteria bacterium]|jgi:signal transduction histidine kinase
MKLLFFKSLRVRLMLLVLIAVIPVWAAIVYTAAEQKQSTVAGIQRNVLQLAEFSAREEEQALQGTRQILIALANFVREFDENPAGCSAFCADLLKELRRYANLGAIKPDGEVFCSGVPMQQPANAADQPWFQHAVERGGFAVGDYHVGRITGKQVLVMAYPYRVVGDNQAAVVFAALDLKWLSRYIFKIASQLPEGFTVTQIDKNAAVLARQPDAEKWVGRTMTEHAALREILSQKTGVMEARGDGDISYIYAFTPLHSSFRKEPVYMILGIPSQLAFADFNRVLRRNLVLLGIVSLLAMIAAWFGSDLFIVRRVKALAGASRRLAAGEMSARTGLQYESGELGQLAKTFDEMAKALEQRHAERKRAEIELKRSQELFRNLSAHLQIVREEERTRIARKIHDDLGQALTALKIDLSWLDKKLASQQHLIREKLRSMVTLINETIETVHNVSEDLRPGILDDFGLPAALEWQAEEFQKRTGMECKTSIPFEALDLSKEKSTNLFRIVQEALTNVIRHAHATKVKINLQEKDGKLLLEVVDNGRGITKAAISDSKSFGLIGIKERVHPLGGEVDIVGTPNEGTRLMIRMPIS